MPTIFSAGFCVSLSWVFSPTTMVTVSPLAAPAIVSKVLLSRTTSPLSVLMTRSAFVSLAIALTVAFGNSTSVAFTLSAALAPAPLPLLFVSLDFTVISIVSDLLETA